MTVAKAMTECLKAEGITTVFGYPGAAICPFYDELYKTDIKHVLVRHEVNGGHAASGYARITGKPAAAISSARAWQPVRCVRIRLQPVSRASASTWRRVAGV